MNFDLGLNYISEFYFVLVRFHIFSISQLYPESNIVQIVNNKY